MEESNNVKAAFADWLNTNIKAAEERSKKSKKNNSPNKPKEEPKEQPPTEDAKSYPVGSRVRHKDRKLGEETSL